MCGIYVAVAEAAGNKVLAGLKRLEYRGYDSWGVAAMKPGQLELEKHVGKIGQVESLELPDSFLAIGHTRWATHGGVTQVNAHPHLASDGSFALVQNGVVENYQILKKELQGGGYDFKTQTDTEVIVGLLEKAQQGSGRLTTDEVQAVMKKLDGRSTVALLTQTGEVFAFRSGSPLLIGRNQRGEWFLASDLLSLSADATEYLSVEQQQLVHLDADRQLQLFDASGKIVSQPIFSEVQVSALKLDKEGFDHFMLKEIYEQGHVLHHVVDGQIEAWSQLIQAIKKSRTVFTVGAGSASFAAGQIAYYLRTIGIQAQELKSYEAASYRWLWSASDLCIAISQSGETADTNEVVEWMKADGVKIASLVNMNGSSLTALSDIPLMLQIGPEIGVASTKALTAQMLWGKILQLFLADEKSIDIRKKIDSIEDKISNWLSDQKITKQIRKLADRLGTNQRVFLLGRGELFYPTLESALKLKEISYLHAEGFSGGELKHGVIALIEKGTPVICLISNDEEQAAMLNAAAEVKARGAWVIGIADQSAEVFDDWIQIPDLEEGRAIATILPAQLLTYYLAVSKGLDPDKPRNLAKSVTVK